MQNTVLITRGGKLESRHTIHAVVLDARKRLVAYTGDPDFPTFFRSSAKPFQTLALFRTGVMDHFGFSESEIALMTASHNGEEFHIRGVRRLLGRIGVSEGQLRCGFHPPYYPRAAQSFYARNTPPSPVYNNCSGKHAGMLAACVCHHYDLDTYMLPDHPHQRVIKDVIAEFSQVPVSQIEVGVDGCGVPAFYLSLRQMAWMNVNFALSQEDAILRLRNALVHHPEYLAGTDRFDTIFIQTLAGKALTKVGAEAIQSFIFFEPEVYGVVVKCEDGTRRGVEAAAVEVLLQMELISEEEANHLRPFWRPVIRNHSGTEVGEIVPHITLIREQ